MYKKWFAVIIGISLFGCESLGVHLSVPVSIDSTTKETVDEPSSNHQIHFYDLTQKKLDLYKKPTVRARLNQPLEKALLRYQYRIGAGDILNITVWDHPELTIPAGSYRSSEESGNWVHADGTIFYPYIGFIHVEGKTVIEVRHELTKRLKEFIEKPQIDVNIAAFRSQKAYITGAVNKQGKQIITNIPLTLIDAINQASGLTNEADWNNVTIIRNGKEEKVSLYALLEKGDQTQNRLLKNGDIVHVPSNDQLKVFVMGEVNQPQLLKMDRAGMSLTEALSNVGGLDKLDADATGVFVIRSLNKEKRVVEKTNKNTSTTRSKMEIIETDDREKNKKVEMIKHTYVYQLNVKEATAFAIGVEFDLQPYDIVYVTTAPIARWNRVVKQLLPTISSFNELSEGALRVRNWPS